ncbi:uncharacterized protein [Amphiura filiformis]|uniref:uncharacterized protein n=1 Tax=Amphiura filiformis TaxID=82378 RepID=UPI003B21569A
MGEIQLILLQHTKYGSKLSKYGSDNTEEENQATQSAVDILGHAPCIGDFLNLKSGEEVMDIIGGYVKVLGSDHHRLRHLVHLLRTQQLRAVLLHSSNDGTKDDGVMKAYSEDVLGSIDVEVDSDVLGATWDGQVASISHENYPIAFLHVLTQTFSIWLPHITTQHSNQVARLLVQSFSSDTPQQDGNLTMSSIARAFLSSDVCMESKELQTELLSAAFRCISNSAGFFSPKKSSKGQRSSSGIIMKYGKLLSMLTEVTDIQDTNWEVLEAVGSEFSTLLKDNTSAQGSSKKVKGAVKNILNILNVLDQLPLTHMLPTNQDRCMLGLVVIDAMVTGWLATGDIACQPQLIEALCFCRNLEMNILKAMKSTGILKCFEVSSMLAYIINKHMHAWEFVQETNQADSLSGRFLVLDDVTQMLMRQWMQKAAHRASQEENILMDVIKLIEGKISALIAKLKSSRPSARLNHLHGAIPLLTTVATIIQRTASPQTQDNKNRTYNEAVKKLCSWLQELLTSVEVDAAEEVDVLLVGCLAKSAVAVVMCQKAGREDGVQTVSDQDASVVAMEEDDSSPALATKKSKKKRTVESVEETDDASLWDGVLEPILHLALTHIGRMKGVEPSDPKAKRKEGQQVGQAAILSACLDYVRTVCDFVENHRGKIDGGIMGKMWTRVSMAMSMEEDGQCKAEILRAASSILTCMDVDLFSKTLEETLQILSMTELSPASVASLQSCVLTCQVLPDCQLSEEKHKFLQENIPKAITSLHCLLVESVRDWSMTGVLALNILTTINSVMTSSKKLLEPKQALQTLQACLAVQFTSVPDDYFPAVFSTMYLLLKSLLEAFPQAVVHCMAAYMASLQHMLRGVMRRCHQGSEGAGRIGDQELFSCAENMERLLTQLSAHKKEVGKFVIVLVAEYINELQKGTLLPFVKRALVVGVYNLVDVCDEKDVSLLQATLPHNVKEIYTEFYSDYKKYHKYKGRV